MTYNGWYAIKANQFQTKVDTPLNKENKPRWGVKSYNFVKLYRP